MWSCWWLLNNVKGDVACGEKAVEHVIELVLDVELLVVTATTLKVMELVVII